ncbi:hypothetical protein NL108_017463 [Boleophthalmus pectinirostris]|nr:hypothetical protein NL108_017463 [Boleophthalmus pectinirostris]
MKCHDKSQNQTSPEDTNPRKTLVDLTLGDSYKNPETHHRVQVRPGPTRSHQVPPGPVQVRMRVRNSSLVFGSSLKTPSIVLVTVLEFIFCTPRITIHMCL